jgi:hypothetical protein
MIMMQTAAVCAAIVIALAIARMTLAMGHQGKFDLIIRAGGVIDRRNGVDALMAAISKGPPAECQQLIGQRLRL